jgi:6-phosphogluconolactonase
VPAEAVVLSGAKSLFRAAAAAVVREAESALREHGAFTIALAGGSTPRGLYELLAADAAFRDRIDWRRVDVFWGDERLVPPDHPESNYRMAHGALLSKVPIPPDRVHRIHGEEADPARAAADYEDVMRAAFGLEAGQVPRFDCVLLGLGADGHTASLFPGSPALEERSRLAVSTWVKTLSANRITLTLPVFNSAASVLFLASGAGKAEALRAIVERGSGPPVLPAQMVVPHAGTLTVMADAPAARLLHTAAVPGPRGSNASARS